MRTASPGANGSCKIHPGARRYPLADRVEAIPLRALADEAPIFPTD